MGAAVWAAVLTAAIAAGVAVYSGQWDPLSTLALDYVGHARGLSPAPPRPKYYIPTRTIGHLPHVRAAFERAGYDVMRNDNYTNDWHVMWTFHNPFYPRGGEPDLPDQMQKLKPEQKVNQIPGSSFFTSKWELAKRADHFDFVPRSFVMPEEHDDFIRYYQSQQTGSIWVKKGSKHRGVTAIDPLDPALSSAGLEETFVQQFVRPYLIDKRMFDVGIYVAITSYNPLRAYYFDNVLLRFCSMEFDEDISNADREAYVIEDDYLPPWSILSLRDYFRMGMSTANAFRGYFASKGVDHGAILERIKAAVALLLVDYESTLVNTAEYYPNGRKNFFALYRFDFIIDRNFKPWLLEVNQSPNLSSKHTRDLANMFKRIANDLLSLVGLFPGSINHPHTTEDDMEVIIHTNDVDIGYDICPDCPDICSTSLCYVCRRCRTPSQSRMIKELISEHRNARGFKRLYPPYDRLRPLMNNITAKGPNNRLLETWLDLKCRDDYTWC